MPRALLFATLVLVTAGAASGQELSVLHIKAVVADPAGTATPVPRHALLVSDDPPTAAPRRIFTRLDGTADVRLRPGHYQVESDQPVVFYGKAYQWTQRIDIVAGRDAVLELTAANAEVEDATSPTTAAAPFAVDPSFLQPRWQDSVVAIWTPTARGSGFLIDGKGLIATNQRVIGSATSVEVQLSPDVKVAASVLAADPMRDVAVLWIDPKVVASLRPVPLGCGDASTPAVVNGQDLFALGAPFRGLKRMTPGTVSRVEPHAIVSDLTLASGSAGGPVFSAGGAVVGITSIVDARAVPVGDACEVVASAEKKMAGASPPDGTHRPTEPVRPFPAAALEDAVQRRAGNLNPYQMSASDFDVAFMTPVHVYGDQYRSEQQRGKEPAVVRPVFDFGNWSEYVAEVRPVLMIRVTPKMVERFWTTVGRAAARTQGVALPPITHVKSGFSRMRVFCGDAEVIPIHPFTLEQRVSETDAVDEGLYVFDPGALGPHCGPVTLVLYSEKEPAKGDTRIVESRIVQQIWQDFAPYRE